MDRSDPRFQAALKNFAAGARFFQRQNYPKAQEFFGKVASSPAHELAVRARVHMALCRQKLARSAPAPKTAEENYNLGVAELNARHLDLAIEHLGKADRTRPERDHVRYALAAAHALQGNIDIAIEHLKTAIALRPGNRFLARSDGDFQSLVSDPRFKRLVGSADGRESGLSF
jgi:tetratricopeptide (TPR) repeat protein